VTGSKKPCHSRRACSSSCFLGSLREPAEPGWRGFGLARFSQTLHLTAVDRAESPCESVCRSERHGGSPSARRAVRRAGFGIRSPGAPSYLGGARAGSVAQFQADTHRSQHTRPMSAPLSSVASVRTLPPL